MKLYLTSGGKAVAELGGKDYEAVVRALRKYAAEKHTPREECGEDTEICLIKNLFGEGIKAEKGMLLTARAHCFRNRRKNEKSMEKRLIFPLIRAARRERRKIDRERVRLYL